MYSAIGSAISNWTRVEIQLYQLFGISLSLTVMQQGGFSGPSPTATAVLEVIDSFRGKVLMIDAAITEALYPADDDAVEILNLWAKESRGLSSLHGNRSKLAHWTVAQEVRNMVPYRVILRPPIYSMKPAIGHQGFIESDVRGWEKSFIEAAHRLSEVVERLASHQGLQRKFVRQMANQVRIRLPYDPSLLEFAIHELTSPE